MKQSENIQSKHAKYATGNPISRYLVNNFLANMRQLAESIEFSNIFDAGCGEGMVLKSLEDIMKEKDCRAIDLEPAEVRDATINLPFCKVEVGSIYNIPEQDNKRELVICSEVLEHLEEPAKGIKELHRICSRYAILSVPNEPIWRILIMARLSYLPSLGNTPGHLNHWSSKSFKAFIAPYFKVIEVRKPLPWTMVLAEKI
jgi:2-polyprenyl-3-methyl-5-hydroxy-6-metoxy-1,4-benzoquinol methylase